MREALLRWGVELRFAGFYDVSNHVSLLNGYGEFVKMLPTIKYREVRDVRRHP